MIRLLVCSSTRGEAKRRFASAALGVAPMRRALAALAIAAELGRELAEASALDSVAARSRTVRVFEQPPEATTPTVRKNEGDDDYDYDYGYDSDGDGDGEARYAREGWYDEFARASDGVDSGARTMSYDEYVEREVAKLELSLIESASASDAGAMRETLDEIAYDIQSDLERIANARALEMTWVGDAAYPPVDFVAFTNEAYVVYDADGSRVMFEPQGEIGRLMQQLTWFSTIFPGNPTALDDYMRCATLVRPCSVEEVLRRCTYENRGSWYRERISRMNAPLSWPYCQPDLEEVYQFCTEFELQSGLCDPRRARERMYLSRTVAINGGTAPCLRWRTNIFGTRECIDRGHR